MFQNTLEIRVTYLHRTDFSLVHVWKILRLPKMSAQILYHNVKIERLGLKTVWDGFKPKKHKYFPAEYGDLFTHFPFFGKFG